MPLQFDVFDSDCGAFSYTGEQLHALHTQFHDIVDAHESGGLGEKPFMAALTGLLAIAPDFLDVHAQIAKHWHYQGKPKKTLDAALLGLGIANKLIPEGFSGLIEWGHLENRAYLRAMDMALHGYMRLRRHKDAAGIIELMLARNPNDNQGVRYLLGSEALRAGDVERAGAVFRAEADNFPPYFYELAICHMLERDWVAAATALRRGFVANPYIAEHLGGHPQPAPLAIWHDSNMASPGTAADYIRAYGAFWHTQPDSFAFTRWLFNHPEIMVERAAILACQEALLWEEDGAARQATMNMATTLTAAIDDGLSTAIVQQRKNRRGKTVWPWLPN
jgi:hypothetical protein